MLSNGTQILRHRYTLMTRLDQEPGPETWAATDSLGNDVLIRTWHFHGSAPDDVQRQLWDLEQRNLYRLASSPQADSQLLIMRDADIHRLGPDQGGYFVMVLQTPGFDSLDKLLMTRSRWQWLRDVDQSDVRADLWRGLKRLAQGLGRLHDLQMLHRGISLRSIYLNASVGPSSMRLGRFEWTVRVGDPRQVVASPELSVYPPEFTRSPFPTFSVESDWFMFGALIAQLFTSVERTPTDDQLGRYNAIVTQLLRQTFLRDNERSFLDRLLAPTPDARLATKHDILSQIDQIITTLDNHPIGEGDHLSLVVQLGPQQTLTSAVIAAEPSIVATDIEAQRSFIENDIQGGLLTPNRHDSYILIGRSLCYFIAEYTDHLCDPTGKWDAAFCYNPAEVRYSAADATQTEISRARIVVFQKSTYRNNEDAILKSSVRWTRFFPAVERNTGGSTLSQFHDFFRVTNQIELLMRNDEIFPYEVIERTTTQTDEQLRIREVERTHATTVLLKPPRLSEFLNRERSENRNGDRVFLSDDNELRMRSHAALAEFWKILEIDDADGAVTLRRAFAGPLYAAPDRGFLRAYGMFGAIKLVHRRLLAIQALRNHTFLLHAFLDPSFMYMHNASTELPTPLNPHLDAAKAEAIRSIWSTRPVFAVQGPPGTGKTTLVANLLEQIFADDSVAQVLVSAQAHAAVDVLRKKVTEEMFTTVSPEKRPLAVRIPRSRVDATDNDPYYPEAVSERLLKETLESLGTEGLSPLQEAWRECAEDAYHAFQRRDTEGIVGDFTELVKRAANITYCTTTSATLARLAVSTQTFDWSIIEEAGKAHAFDLVLPLQNGHRWLLIGDHKQLPPYRYDEFMSVLRDLDTAFTMLESLPGRGGELVDLDFIRKWRQEYSDEYKERCRQLWLSWLPVFDRLFTLCSERTGLDGRPRLAKMLTQQHRMHPVISDLVSCAFYGQTLQSMTVDSSGAPLPHVVHPFVGPAGISGRAIVWIDLPDAAQGGAPDSTAHGHYTSEAEIDAVRRFLNSLTVDPSFKETVDVAVLSPYRPQVFRLSQRLKPFYDVPPEWLKPLSGDRYPSHTVDSFQGNQAQVVVVSLVRNNERSTKRAAMGFLGHPERMNVLMSRAEQLLVLVGSWEFFSRQLHDVPADPHQPFGNLRLAFDYLNAAFERGEAIRIPSGTLPMLGGVQ